MLDAAFAICSENFFREFQTKYGPVTITSAYRSPEEEARLCVNNPRCGTLMNISSPYGNHQKALAMDVRAAQQSIMNNFAKQNPQFGVCFPFTGEGGGFTDPEHMILAGIPGAETQGPGCRGVVKACDAGHFDPNSIKDVSPMMYASNGISSSNSLTQFLGMPQQSPYGSQYPMAYQSQMGYQSPMGYQSSGYQSPMAYQSLMGLLFSSLAPRQSLPPPTLYAEIPSTPAPNYPNTNPSVPTPPTLPIPSASLIIAQSMNIPRNGATLISWSSVGMAAESCAVTENNMPFSGGAAGSKVLSPDMTGSAGTITVVLDCYNSVGTNSRKSVDVVVQ